MSLLWFFSFQRIAGWKEPPRYLMGQVVRQVISTQHWSQPPSPKLDTFLLRVGFNKHPKRYITSKTIFVTWNLYSKSIFHPKPSLWPKFYIQNNLIWLPATTKAWDKTLNCHRSHKRCCLSDMWYFVIFAEKNHHFKNHIEIDIFFLN